MVKRTICMICVFVLVVGALLGIYAHAETEVPAPSPRYGQGMQHSSRKTSYRAYPIATAMLLVLAGVGVSCLFDKRG